MGNLEFNTQGATRLIRQAVGTYPWQSNTATTIQIPQVGYLRDLEVLVQGTPTFSGAVAIDVLGPWNLISNFQLNSNVQAGILNLSGDGAAWFNLVQQALEHKGNSDDTSLVAVQNAADFTYQYQVPTASGFSGNALMQVPFKLPLAQKINTLDGYVGIWDLQDPSVQMTLLYTPNSSSNASPFNIYSASHGVAPYYAASNTVTLTTPQNLLTAVKYDPPADSAMDPDFGYVNSLYEEQWNTALGGSKVINWKALANSGYITRLLFSVYDSNNNNGVSSALGGSSNFINLTVGNNAPVIVETVYEFNNRANEEMGHLPPQGVYYIDFLGQDLTMQNVIDTFSVGNINLQMNFSSALGATSSGKVIRQMLQALV
jgi:hypothetical protein